MSLFAPDEFAVSAGVMEVKQKCVVSYVVVEMVVVFAVVFAVMVVGMVKVFAVVPVEIEIEMYRIPAL